MTASHWPQEQCTRIVHLIEEHLPVEPQPNIKCGEKGGPPPMHVHPDIPNLLRNRMEALVRLRVGPPPRRKTLFSDLARGYQAVSAWA